jgi:hypothetical protein
MYPIYTIVTQNYFNVFQHLLDSLKKSPEVLENLTVIGSMLTKEQICVLEKYGVSHLSVDYKFEKSPYSVLAHVWKINLDKIVQKDKFIFIDADCWVQDSQCFQELSVLGETQGFAAVFIPRNKRACLFYKLDCKPPVRAQHLDSLNSGVMSFNSQQKLFDLARQYFKTKSEISGVTEELSFEFASYHLKLNNSIDNKYNGLVGWNRNDVIELKEGKFYINGVCSSIIHNLLSAYRFPQKVLVDGKEESRLVLPLDY